MNRGAPSADGNQFLRSCVGLRNRVVYYDRGAGTPLVLVHGMFGDHMDWAPVLAPLAARHRIIALDLPGFGDSDKPSRPFPAPATCHRWTSPRTSWSCWKNLPHPAVKKNSREIENALDRAWVIDVVFGR